MNSVLRNGCIVLVTGLLAACHSEVNVKIGVAAPMTGELAGYGKDIAQGAQIAVDELNNGRFIIDGHRAHFELVIEDDKALPEEGKAAAQRLIDAKVNAVFGHLNSGVTIPASALYATAGIPELSVSTNPQYTRQGLKTAFRITADDIDQGMVLGTLISDKLHAKSVYMVDDGTTFGTGLAAEVDKVFKTKNLSAPHDSITEKTADYPALVQKIKSSNADIVFFGGDQAIGLPLLKELRKTDANIKFVAADAMCSPPTIKDAAGTADNNFYCTVPGVPPSWLSAGANFTDMYTKKYNNAPGAYAPLAYDGIHIFSQAMQDANSTDPATYLPLMAKSSFDGKIQGSVEFDNKGDIKEGTIVIYQSSGGILKEQRNLL